MNFFFRVKKKIDHRRKLFQQFFPLTNTESNDDDDDKYF